MWPRSGFGIVKNEIIKGLLCLLRRSDPDYVEVRVEFFNSVKPPSALISTTVLPSVSSTNRMVLGILIDRTVLKLAPRV